MANSERGINWPIVLIVGVLVVLVGAWVLGGVAAQQNDDEAQPLREQDRAACSFLAEQGGVHSWEEWLAIVSQGEQMASNVRTDAHPANVLDAFANARVSFDILASGGSTEQILATSALSDIRQACEDL